MFWWALVFLIIAVVFGLLSISGSAFAASGIPLLLCIVFFITALAAVVIEIMERRGTPFI